MRHAPDFPSTESGHSVQSDGIRKSFLRGAGWMTAARVAAAVGVVARYVVFARLLGPRDFGVVGAAMFVEMFLSTGTSPSFDSALVPRSDEAEPYLDSVWLVSLLQGLTVALAMVLLAHPLARFFQIENSYRVFWLVAPIEVLIALKSPGSTGLIYRNLDFQISLALNLAEQISGFAVGLAGVLWLGDWRGLVLGMWAGHLVRTSLTYWYFPYWPRLRFDARRTWELFSYGRWITLRSLADFGCRNLDNLLVGHLLGAAALGEYQMAFRLGEMPATEVAGSVGGASFPLVSRISGKSGSRERLLGVTAGVVAIVGISYALFIMGWGRELISLTIGPKWLGALPPLKLLCLYGIGSGLLGVGMSFLNGLNAPNLSFRLNLVVLLVSATLIYPLTHNFGTLGAAASDVASVFVPLPFVLWFYRKATRSMDSALRASQTVDAAASPSTPGT